MIGLRHTTAIIRFFPVRDRTRAARVIV